MPVSMRNKVDLQGPDGPRSATIQVHLHRRDLETVIGPCSRKTPLVCSLMEIDSR